MKLHRSDNSHHKNYAVALGETAMYYISGNCATSREDLRYEAIAMQRSAATAYGMARSVANTWDMSYTTMAMWQRWAAEYAQNSRDALFALLDYDDAMRRWATSLADEVLLNLV